MKFTERFIQKALLYKFQSHVYKFTNVFYFNNESDWLSFLTSGFCYEVEIKVSRSDFKADFKKNKHVIHEANGKKYYTEKGSLVRSSNPDWDFCRNFPELIECKDYTDPYSFRYNKRQMLTLYYSAMSSVNFREFKNEKLPNKFFYAVPTGLIKEEEIPEYAGLLYVNEDGTIDKIKDAGFIHKEKLDMMRLFNKTYYSYERELNNKLKCEY